MASNLAISLLIGASVTGAVKGIKSLSSSLKVFKDDALSTGDKIRQLAKQSAISIGSAVSTLSGLSGAVVGISKPAIAFESAMADVKKVVDFKTPDGFKKLSGDLLELTRTLPMTGEELAAIAASGGQLGVAEEDIKAFTTTIAKMSVAFDMSAEDSGDAMAKLANVYKIPISEIGKLGDAINELSNSSPAKASDIVSTLGRIGGVAKQFGLTENAAAALANSFISLGKAPEVAGTAINGMLTKLMTADKGGKKFQAALATVGVSAKQLKADIAKNGEQALISFLKRIQTMPKEMQMGILVDLFGIEYADDVAVLAGNTKVLEDSLKTLQETDSKGKPKYLGSMEKEFAARAATTENSLKLLKNSITEIAVQVGSQFLPIINLVVSKLRPVIYSIANWIGKHQELVAVIAQLSVGIGAGIAAALALNGVFGGMLALFAAGKNVISGVHIGFTVLAKITRLNMSLFMQLWRLFSGGLLNSVKLVTLALKALAVSGFGLVKAAVIAVITTLKTLLLSSLSLAKAAFLGFATILKTVVVSAFGLLKTAIVAVSRAFLFNPIGLAITAIALGAYLIYRYWSPIKTFFGQLWNWVSAKFSAAWKSISGLWSQAVTWFNGIWENIKTFFNSGISNITTTILNWSPLGLFQQIFSGVLAWFGIDIPAKFGNFGKNMIDGLINGIRGAWEGAKQVVSDLGDGIKSWFAEKLGIHSPSRVFMGYGENTVDGLVIGVAKSAVKAAGAVTGMGEQMQQAMPKTLSAPVIETATKIATAAPKAVTAAPRSITSQAQQLSALAAKQVTASTTPVKTNKAKQKTANQRRVNRQAADKATAALTASYLPAHLRRQLSQTQKITKSPVSQTKTVQAMKPIVLPKPQTEKPAQSMPVTQAANPVVALPTPPVTQYESLQHTMQAQNMHTAPQARNGIVVNFNPTINVSEASSQGVVEQVQQGLQMSLREFEQLINRVVDQKMRRAY